ncbi:hypothetical protein INN71_03015 [Nocardioides sp. ChNu-153]|uniref:hypothetical protein n=1 Tax=unclassified Nocardioides TaxID=2615069 RepID=UPI002404A481|nr:MULTISPECIES: hypothetical protein [unclassified Nocardioides]MDF9716080.1 hypothetical protein [Nocardioides sp. ChNu-99]MDN7120356.1 hypothetical protein [Nocardioides sp. ChNu-153]
MHPPPYQPPPPRPPHQPPYGQQPYGQQPAYPPAWLDLHVKGNALTSALNGPRALVNGVPARVSYGGNRLPIPPGPVQVECYLHWIFQQGRATVQFHARPGDVVPVFYAPPYVAFVGGRIGHVPQQRPGLWAFLLLMVVVLLALTLNVALWLA